MAYTTSVTIGNPNEMLDLIRDEMVTDGWVLERSDGLPSGGKVLSDASADEATFVSARARNTGFDANTNVGVGTADSVSPAEVWDLPGSPDNLDDGRIINFGQRESSIIQGFEGDDSGGADYTRVSVFTGDNAAGNGRYMHCVAECRPGLFWHLLFGTINKAGTFSGGFYCTGSAVGDSGGDSIWPFEWNMPRSSSRGTSWIRCDDFFTGVSQTGDGGTSRWFEDWAFAGQEGAVANMFGPLYQGGLQAFNQRTPFAPIWAIIHNSTSSNPINTAWKLLGHIPDVRFCSMEGREPNETITIGGDTWHLFPMFRKTTDGVSILGDAYKNTFASGSAPNDDSNLMGLAYKENP